MGVKELNREQIEKLKQDMLCQRDEHVSYGELANADKIITDEEVFKEFAGTEFVEEDF